MEKYKVLIEDDFEVMGNGLGNVAKHQYLPAKFLMDTAKELDIQLTFMVDVAQVLFFSKIEKQNKDIYLQRKLWDETILLMKEKGFDVQLHLHPQWHNAKYENPFFFLDNKWNIGLYEKHIQEELIDSSISYLINLIQNIDVNHKIIAFKAGSWGLQPSETLFDILSRNGIKLVLGVQKGMYIPSNNVDNRNLEEPIYPYYPDFKDINKCSQTQKEIQIIPLFPYKPSIKSTFGLFVKKNSDKFFDRNDNIKSLYFSEIPKDILNLSPIKMSISKNILYNPYQTHLKIGDQSFDYLKKSFDYCISFLKNNNYSGCPIIIESHTKQFINNYENIKKFLIYIKIKYDNEIEFMDISNYYNIRLNKTKRC